MIQEIKWYMMVEIRHLKHEGIDYEPPEKAPAKYRHQSLRFNPEEPPGDASDTDYYIDETDKTEWGLALLPISGASYCQNRNIHGDLD